MNLGDILPELFSGAAITLELLLLSLIIGFCLALFITLLCETDYVFKKPIQTLISFWVFLIRGTPLLVQIFIIYYGSGQLSFLKHTVLWDLLKHPMGCAVTALAINTSAYTTVLLRGALAAVPKGEREAALALGLSQSQMMRRVILPRAFRMILPAYSNEIIMILKGTSLASTITLMDLMGVTQHFIGMTYQTIPLLLLAGMIYLILNGLIIGGFRLLEKPASLKRVSNVI